MRNFLLIVLCFCILSACRKAGNVSPKISAGLFGKWELRRVRGGLAGYDSTFTAGNATMFQFNRDSTYTHFLRGTVNASGIFHIIKNAGSGSYNEMVFDTSVTGDPFILNGTQLTFGTTVADGFEYDYEKISN